MPATNDLRSRGKGRFPLAAARKIFDFGAPTHLQGTFVDSSRLDSAGWSDGRAVDARVGFIVLREGKR